MFTEDDDEHFQFLNTGTICTYANSLNELSI